MFTLLKSVTALMKALGWINKTLCEAQMNFTRTLYEAEAFFWEFTRYGAFNYHIIVYFKRGYAIPILKFTEYLHYGELSSTHITWLSIQGP